MLSDWILSENPTICVYKKQTQNNMKKLESKVTGTRQMQTKRKKWQWQAKRRNSSINSK